MPRIPFHLIGCAAVVILGACGDDKPEPAKPVAPAEQGRPETRKVLAADAVGYDGKALQKSLDKMLDAKDRQAKELEDAQQRADPAEPEKPAHE